MSAQRERDLRELIAQRLRRDAGRAERRDGAAGGAGRIRCGLHQRRGFGNCDRGRAGHWLLTLTEVAQLAGYVANAVKIPAIVDADTGFGGAENAGAHDSRIGARRTGRLSHRRPGISETLRPSCGQIAGRRRRDD